MKQMKSHPILNKLLLHNKQKDLSALKIFSCFEQLSDLDTKEIDYSILKSLLKSQDPLINFHAKSLMVSEICKI